MKKIGILTIHGMGNQEEEFDEDLRVRLRKKVGNEVADDLEFQRLFYQDQIQGEQENVWARMENESLGWGWLRKFFLFFFSDATTYQYKPTRANSVYEKVHTAIKKQIDNLRTVLGSDAPVVIIAHSLGCHVISNHIWDAQSDSRIWENNPASNFQKLATASYMFTTGCNIPLFVSGLSRIEAINKPNDDFHWINFYAKPDILGWPLKPLSRGFPNSYDSIVDEDRRKWMGITPLAHTRYWRWGNVVGDMAEEIVKLHARP